MRRSLISHKDIHDSIGQHFQVDPSRWPRQGPPAWSITLFDGIIEMSEMNIA
jgi:hypothetical protein